MQLTFSISVQVMFEKNNVEKNNVENMSIVVQIAR